MYDAVADPYCYPGSRVLRNIPDLRNQDELDAFEAMATARRFLEPMPAGRWSLRHYQAVHRHIFQDVYTWAGRPRTIRISRGTSMFCYPEHLAGEARRVFASLRAQGALHGRDAPGFAQAAAHILAELNALHLFRDGNGRAQLAFMTLLADHAGHPLDLERLEPEPFLVAMIASFNGNEQPLAGQFLRFIQSHPVEPRK